VDLNTFDNHAKQGACPICNGKNLTRQHESGCQNTLLWCNNCGGYPANCNGRLYLHSDSNVLDCEVCGEKRASASDHGILSLWS
jgi:uncharacterized protein YbaR (Trm112 family)